MQTVGRPPSAATCRAPSSTSSRGRAATDSSMRRRTRADGGADQPTGRASLSGLGRRASSYERARFRDFTTSLGGPARRDRLWFFAGYQFLRDDDSQPGTDPAFPRTYAQDKVFAKLTWKLTPRLRLEQSVHYESGLNPDRPTIVTPLEATARRHISVPAITFGHLTHTVSPSTVWDVRVGRFVYTQQSTPSSGNPNTPSRLDSATGITSGAPAPHLVDDHPRDGEATVNHCRADVLGDHLESGRTIERGEHLAIRTIQPASIRRQQQGAVPGRFERGRQSRGWPSPRRPSPVTRSPWAIGSPSLPACVSTAVAPAARICMPSTPRSGNRRHRTWPGDAVRGTSCARTRPAEADADGRTVLRASYGRFSGCADRRTGAVPSGATPVTTTAFVDAVEAAARLARRSQSQPRTRSADASAAHGRVFGRSRSRGRRTGRAGARVCSEEWRPLHRLDGCGRAVRPGAARAAGRAHRGCVPARQPARRPPVLLTNRDNYSSPKRPRDRGRQAPVRRLRPSGRTFSRRRAAASSGANAAGAQVVALERDRSGAIPTT